MVFITGMKKWVTSNYHYMVPEVDESLSALSPDFSSYFEAIQRGISRLGDKAVPVVIGPVSMVRFCNFKLAAATDVQRFALLEQFLPVYTELLSKLAATGVKEIQIHEPVLVFAETSLSPLFAQAFPAILKSIGNTTINMVSFFEDVGEENYKWLVGLKEVKTISLDFTRGDSLPLIKKLGFPQDKTLGAGLIDGRSVWKVDPAVVNPILAEISKIGCDVRIQPSSSLQFVPWSLSCEPELLEHTAGPVLAFSKQKLSEVVALCREANGESSLLLKDAATAWTKYRAALSADQKISQRIASLTEANFARAESYSARRPKQLKGMPLLPTTSIGSFPQTKEIRSLRNQFKRNKITKQEYEAAIDQQIAYMIGIQEGIGLDILVHGEPERTDMVEFFAQQMDGMLFSRNGWVQSFGSRCVRPPIFWNDISRPSAMTVREFQVAQRLTKKPVKGMLTVSSQMNEMSRSFQFTIHSPIILTFSSL
jgi:5-methyltetrahydropteroyltriglutamate--homocysteine methyltransferase